MPKKLEEDLRREAEKKFPGDKKRQDRYVYGYLNKHGLLHMNRGKKK